ncbi:hypothetical protein HS7_06260 [Sulfolobales archaeon HS-7]|nr:hypothetical protein HS7_06260 [Sulfolobales archaeon HS-7]
MGQKRGRVGVKVEVNGIYFLCVFREGVLEHIFIGEDKLGKVREEITYSNFGVGLQYSGELIHECERLGEMISVKLKKLAEDK